MKASDLLVKSLESEGVSYIFGIPGEENLDLLESIRKSSIKVIITRHEQAAGFMAATYGRLTGKVGVCMSTLGPGATNLTTAAAFAQLGGMPLCLITGQKPIKKSKQGLFQIIDIIDLMQPLTKSAHRIIVGDQIPSLIRNAFRTALDERSGSVHLELPEDVAQEQSDAHLIPTSKIIYPIAPIESLDQAVDMIKKAKSPLLLVGAGANRKKVSEVLSEFIEHTHLYFFTTQMGKGVIDERSPYCLGTAALSDHDFLHCAIEKADLIINVGHDIVEKPPFLMKEDDKKVIHVNFYAAEIDEVYFPQLDVVGDIAYSIEYISQALGKHKDWEHDYFYRVKNELELHLSKYFSDDRFPILPQRLVHLMRNSLSDDAIITLDNGMYKIWFARNYKCYLPNTLLLDNALATMGAGLPSAMAAKLVYPKKDVVAICGDGGFMMNSQELETAVRLNLNLTVIILNDHGYGMIKWKQEDMGFKDFGLSYGNPDFKLYAESYGAHGYRPSNDQEFQDTLKQCLSTDGVHLIDLAIDYSLNHEILNVLLKEKTCIL
jgi:acetolactate synthase-1/2/3 large subunit